VSQPAYGPEFAEAFRDLMGDVLSREVKLTARVLASIPDEGREYRPHPKSRSAWELAWHVAAGVWFLDGHRRASQTHMVHHRGQLASYLQQGAEYRRGKR
jgi:hypothetical protein